MAASVAVGYVVAGNSGFERSAAVEAMRLRVASLVQDDDSVSAREELAAHAAMLYSLTQRYTVQAVQAKQSEHAAKFQKLALSCHAAYVRTLIAMEGLKQQARGRAQVALSVKSSDGDGNGAE